MLRAIRPIAKQKVQEIKQNPNPRSEVNEREKKRRMVNQYRFGGIFNLMKENYDAAMDDFDHALEIDPENASMYVNRGSVYDRKGDIEKAISEYGRAIELDPDESDCYYLRAMSYRSKGDLKAARRDLRRAAKMGDGRARKELENL